MTDREKIEAVFYAFGVETKEGEKSIMAAGRKLYFDPKGRLEKILDYTAGLRATDVSSREIS